jgi:molybdate transport system substrate-binding protein
VRRFLVVLVLAGACGKSAPETTLMVSVAASLRDVVDALATDFRGSHPGVQFDLNSGSSGVLAQQIEQGAPVDVFVSAGRLEVDRLAEKGLLAGTPAVLARNRLVLAVPKDSAFVGKAPRDLLVSPELARLATGDPATVPFGRYAKEALTGAGLWETVSPKAIYANDVRQAITYAQEHAVDAAIVYATDVSAKDGLVALGELPGGDRVRIEAVAARLKRSTAAAAQTFLEHLASAAAATEFARRGFLPVER